MNSITTCTTKKKWDFCFVIPCIPFKHRSEDIIEFFFVAVAYCWYIIIKLWVHTVVRSSLDGISKNFICYKQKIVQVNLCNLPGKGEQKHFAASPIQSCIKGMNLQAQNMRCGLTNNPGSLNVKTESSQCQHPLDTPKAVTFLQSFTALKSHDQLI